MGECRHSVLRRHQPEFASHRNLAHLPLTSSGRHLVSRSTRLALVGPTMLPYQYIAVDCKAAKSPWRRLHCSLHCFESSILGPLFPWQYPRAREPLSGAQQRFLQRANSGSASDADRLWPSPNPFSELVLLDWGFHGPAPQFQSPRLGPTVPSLWQSSTYSRRSSTPNAILCNRLPGLRPTILT
ncbi:hypothetical protein LY76DRAFT_66210 [Colletotrichum caudatum]|nr:hypothetical protein LY76DRAFT_66210 [Colletotrichum caudatum]